jgi:hypothetical protein
MESQVYEEWHCKKTPFQITDKSDALLLESMVSLYWLVQV